MIVVPVTYLLLILWFIVFLILDRENGQRFTFYGQIGNGLFGVALGLYTVLGEVWLNINENTVTTFQYAAGVLNSTSAVQTNVYSVTTYTSNPLTYYLGLFLTFLGLLVAYAAYANLTGSKK